MELFPECIFKKKLMHQPVLFAKKFIACAVLSLLLLSALLLIGTDTHNLIHPLLIFVLGGMAFVYPYILLVVWETRERKRGALFSVIYRINDAVAILTGFSLLMFGWKKLAGLQFRVPLSIADLPMSQQDGETLTWYYFGYSPVFGFIVALLQITGAILLLFPKTRLGGCLLLLPVMMNIMLLNIFYRMNAGALLQSIALAIGLLYLLLLYKKPMVKFLRQIMQEHKQSSFKRYLSTAVVCILISLGIVYANKKAIRNESPLHGSYEVKQIGKNTQEMFYNNITGKDSVLTKIYFDLNNVCVMEFNDPGKRNIEKYDFDPIKHELYTSVKSSGKYMPVHLRADVINKKELWLTGSVGKDSLRLLLSKLQ